MSEEGEWVSKIVVMKAAEDFRVALLSSVPKLTGEFADHEVRRVVRIAAEASGRTYTNPIERREAIATMLNYHASTLISANTFAGSDDYEQILQDVLESERKNVDRLGVGGL